MIFTQALSGNWILKSALPFKIKKSVELKDLKITTFGLKFGGKFGNRVKINKNQSLKVIPDCKNMKCLVK